tara:strand:- start:531 stop:1850 length:1320 start_codon:yes stop_codon:yes gene_type:complete
MERKFGMKRKNIVILTAVHPYLDSGIIAFDLMQILKQAKYKVIIITNATLEKNYKNTISLNPSITIDFTNRVLNRLKITLNRILKKDSANLDPNYYMFGLNQDSNNSLAEKVLQMLPFKVDSFIYLFPQNFLNTEDLNYLNKKSGAPIFWSMADMAAITGGCHYAWNCLGYTNKCGSCPGVYSDDKNDLTHQLWKEKKKYIESSNIIPVAGSEWQFNQLKNSSLFINKNKYKILLPIDDELFKPNSKTEARKKLGLPKDKKIIFFGAALLNQKRKGLKELIESLVILKSEIQKEDTDDIFLAIAGRSNQHLDNEIPFAYKTLGYLNYNQLATAYQAADVFVCPSIEDSGPMMINQSIMCGTPVVSFEMGVALDLVINNETGFKVENKNTLKFAKAINNILSLPAKEMEKMSSNCRALGIEKTSMHSIKKQWINILENEL